MPLGELAQFALQIDAGSLSGVQEFCSVALYGNPQEEKRQPSPIGGLVIYYNEIKEQQTWTEMNY